MTKRERIVYWTTTGIVCAVMVYSILNFTLFDRFPFPEGGFVHLGLPGYFKIELTTAKIFLCLLAVSYFYFSKRNGIPIRRNAHAQP